MDFHPRRRRIMNRREFLQAGAAVAFGLGALPALAADDKKDDPFGGFALGVQSYTFRKFNLEQALKRMKECGVSYGEFYNGKQQIPRDASAEQLATMLKLCKEYGITPNAYGVEAFSKNHDNNKKVFDFAKSISVKSISADPTVDAFDSLDKLCEEYKIAIAIHPHGPGSRWTDAEQIMKAVKDHNPLIGTCLDTGHLIRMAQVGKKLDVAEQVKIMGARNFGLHLKDHDNKRKVDVIYGKDGGVLDIVSILKALREVKFTGSISIEYEAKEDEPTEDVKACVTIFKESVKKLG
ncbi:MAG: sugar phosphate isomerase/epimerase [Gemmataceae bacterium]|nr:sugar phosphate isomerase/epimerase [Gemmataceae bacterium]